MKNTLALWRIAAARNRPGNLWMDSSATVGVQRSSRSEVVILAAMPPILTNLRARVGSAVGPAVVCRWRGISLLASSVSNRFPHMP